MKKLYKSIKVKDLTQEKVSIRVHKMTEEEIKAVLEAYPKEVARIQGRKNGENSWKVRSKGKTKKESSEMMRDVALKRWEVLDLKK